MDQFSTHVGAYAVGAVFLGGIVSGLTQTLKLAYPDRFQGRAVKLFAFYFSLVVGLLIELLTAPDGLGWKALALSILQGLLIGVMIALAAMGIHNAARSTGKADAALQLPTPTDSGATVPTSDATASTNESPDATGNEG